MSKSILDSKQIISKSMVLLLLLSTAATGWAYEGKTSRENGVRVQVTPQVLSHNKPIQFQIRLNTHSVELSQDMLVVAELRDSQGRTYKPVQWEGSPPGGHHRSGTLTFSALQPPVENVTLVLHDVGGVAQRTFSWTIE